MGAFRSALRAYACVGLAAFLCLIGIDRVGAEPIRVVAVGDVMPHSLQHAAPPDPVFDPQTIARISGADLAFANLEGVLLDADLPARPCGRVTSACFRFRIPERYAGELARMGFDAVSLANNHSTDFGEDGRISTVSALARAGMGSTGLPGQPPFKFHIGGRSVAFLAFAANLGVEDLRDERRMRGLVSRAARSADIVIVSFHMGAEGPAATRTPPGTERFFDADRGNPRAAARAVIAAGADLVFGHGPHVVRGVEIVEGRLVAYSLGNFWGGPGLGVSGVAGVAPLLEVDLEPDGRLACAMVHSLKASVHRTPLPDPEREAARMMARLSTADFPASEGRMFDDGVITPSPRRCAMALR